MKGKAKKNLKQRSCGERFEKRQLKTNKAVSEMHLKDEKLKVLKSY